jgi:hypothetical protein
MGRTKHGTDIASYSREISAQGIDYNYEINDIHTYSVDGIRLDNIPYMEYMNDGLERREY